MNLTIALSATMYNSTVSLLSKKFACTLRLSCRLWMEHLVELIVNNLVVN